MNLNERVAFIKGLVEGLEIDAQSRENKVLLSVIELLDDLAVTVTDLENENERIWETIEGVDDDLADLEEDYYGYNECDCDDHDCDCDCDCDDDFDYEVTCPICNEVICLTEDLLDKGSIVCPKCGEPLEFDLDDIVYEEEIDSDK